MASERLSPHIWRLLDEALAQRREGVVPERAQDILAIELENSEGVAFLAAAARAPGSSSTATEEWSAAKRSSSIPNRRNGSASKSPGWVEISEEREGGGHSTFLENPAKFNQIVCEFMS